MEALVDAAVRDAETGDREIDPSVLLLWARLYAEREARAALSTARPAARFGHLLWPSYQVCTGSDYTLWWHTRSDSQHPDFDEAVLCTYFKPQHEWFSSNDCDGDKCNLLAHLWQRQRASVEVARLELLKSYIGTNVSLWEQTNKRHIIAAIASNRHTRVTQTLRDLSVAAVAMNREALHAEYASPPRRYPCRPSGTGQACMPSFAGVPLAQGLLIRQSCCSTSFVCLFGPIRMTSDTRHTACNMTDACNVQHTRRLLAVCRRQCPSRRDPAMSTCC